MFFWYDGVAGMARRVASKGIGLEMDWERLGCSHNPRIAIWHSLHR